MERSRGNSLRHRAAECWAGARSASSSECPSGAKSAAQCRQWLRAECPSGAKSAPGWGRWGATSMPTAKHPCVSKVGGRLSTPAMRLGVAHRLIKPDTVPSRSRHRQSQTICTAGIFPRHRVDLVPDRRRLPPELPPDTSLKDRSTAHRPRLLRLPQRHAKVAVARYDEVARCKPPATGSRGRRCPELSCGERTLLRLPTCWLWGAGLPE
jgi:hypothetical protein